MACPPRDQTVRRCGRTPETVLADAEGFRPQSAQKTADHGAQTADLQGSGEPVCHVEDDQPEDARSGTD